MNRDILQKQRDKGFCQFSISVVLPRCLFSDYRRVGAKPISWPSDPSTTARRDPAVIAGPTFYEFRESLLTVNCCLSQKTLQQIRLYYGSACTGAFAARVRMRTETRCTRPFWALRVRSF